MQRTLLSLSGRLDLLLSQSSAAGGGDDDEGAGGGAAPRVVYEESGSEDGGAEVDVEDAFAPRGGDSGSDDELGDFEVRGAPLQLLLLLQCTVLFASAAVRRCGAAGGSARCSASLQGARHSLALPLNPASPYPPPG